MATIKKSATGYQVRYRTPDGSSRSATFSKRAEAERFLIGTEHAKLTSSYVDPSAGRETFGDWWAKCQAATVDLRPSTRARDIGYGKRYLLPHFEKKRLGRIDHLAVKTWIADLTATGLAPATVVKAAQLLSRTLRAAVDAGLIPSNPAERVALPRIERNEMRFLNPSEVATLAESIDPRYRGFVLLGAYGGLRFGELASLRRNRIDVLRSRLDVAETVVEVQGYHHVGPPKTRAGRRSVPLPRFILDAIDDNLKTLTPTDLVFSAPEGGFLRASLFRRRIWHPAVERAGLTPLRCHDLRHTAVALWIAAGASPKEIAARAGHTSVVTVLDRYGHLLPGSEDRVNDALDIMARAASTSSANVVEMNRVVS